MLGINGNANIAAGIPGGQGSVGATLAAGTRNAGNAQLLEQSVGEGSAGKAPYVLLGLVAIYVVWAWISQNERITESLRPANIAANLHNILMITMIAVIGLVSAKVLFTKLTALGVPGADWIGQIVAAA